MPTQFYSNDVLTEILTNPGNNQSINLNLLSTEQLGNVYNGLTYTQANGLTDEQQATFAFWRNRPQIVQPQSAADTQIVTFQTGTITCGDTATITTRAECVGEDHWITWVDQAQIAATESTWTAWTIAQPAQPVTYRGAPLLRADQLPTQTPEMAEYDRRLRAEWSEAEQAQTIARALLESLLTPEQLASLKTHRFFEVVGQSRKRYRIYEGSHGNIRELDAHGKIVASLCGQPNGVPQADMMLAQKLQLEADEAGFLRQANRHAA